MDSKLKFMQRPSCHINCHPKARHLTTFTTAALASQSAQYPALFFQLHGFDVIGLAHNTQQLIIIKHNTSLENTRKYYKCLFKYYIYMIIYVICYKPVVYTSL